MTPVVNTRIEPLSLVLEFARASSAGNPFAFEFAPQEYLLRSGEGSYETASFPWSTELLAALQALRDPARDASIAQRVGEILRSFLAQTEWAAHEAELLAAVEKQQPVILTVRSAAAELYALPWELLTLRKSGQHIGELPRLVIRYAWPNTVAAPESAAPRPAGGRVLFAWSAAAGAVPAAEHLAAITRASRDAAPTFVVERDVLPNVSCAKLIAAFDAAAKSGAPIAVLHLLAHGTVTGGTFGLSLDGDSADSGPVTVDAGRLRQLLGPYAGMVRLVVLAACDSGNSGAPGNQLGSIAQTLHRGGIAQVVASRYPLSVHGSIALTQTLYEQLLHESASVESALLVVRRRLLEDPQRLDWASVQLYSGDDDPGRPIIFRPEYGFAALSAVRSDHLDAQEIIIKPAQRVGLQFEPGLVERLLEDVEGEPGALAVLQQALDVLWQKRTKMLLTQKTYDDEGGVAGIVNQHANRVFESLSPAEQAQAKQLLLWLGCEWTAQGGNRRRLPISTARPDAAEPAASFDRVLRRLLDERLCVSDAKGQEPGNIEVAHSALLHKWPRLTEWVFAERAMLEARDNLEQWLAEWQARGTLLSNSQLGYAKLALERHPIAFSPGAREHYAKSKTAADEMENFSRIGIDCLRLSTVKNLYPTDATRQAVVMREAMSSHQVTTVPGWVETAYDILHNHYLTVFEQQQRQEIYDACISPDDDLLTLVLRDGTVWTTANLREWREMKCSLLKPAALAACYSPDSKHLLTVCKDGTARVQLADGSGVPLVISSHRASVTSCAYAPDGSLFLTGCLDGEARVFDAHSGKSMGSMGGHQDGVTGIAWSPDSRRYYTACGAGKVRVMELRASSIPKVILDEKAPIRALALSPDGEKLAVGSNDHAIRIYDLKKLDAPRVLNGHSGRLWNLAWSATGDRILSCSADDTARVWTIDGSRPPRLLSGHRQDVYAAIWKPDGKIIVTASQDRRLRLWDARRTELLEPTQITAQTRLGADFLLPGGELRLGAKIVPSPDGVYRATALDDGGIRIEKQDGKAAPWLIAADGGALCALFWSAELQLISVAADHCVRVMDPMKRGITVLSGHTAPLTSILPMKQRLLTTSEDRTARLYTLDGSRPPAVLANHQSAVMLGTVLSAAENSNQFSILTIEGCGIVRLWAPSGAHSLILGNDRPDLAFGIKRDLRQVVTAIRDQELYYLWDLPPFADVLARLKKSPMLTLSAEERAQFFL